MLCWYTLLFADLTYSWRGVHSLPVTTDSNFILLDFQILLKHAGFQQLQQWKKRIIKIIWNLKNILYIFFGLKKFRLQPHRMRKKFSNRACINSKDSCHRIQIQTDFSNFSLLILKWSWHKNCEDMVMLFQYFKQSILILVLVVSWSLNQIVFRLMD